LLNIAYFLIGLWASGKISKINAAKVLPSSSFGYDLALQNKSAHFTYLAMFLSENITRHSIFFRFIKFGRTWLTCRETSDHSILEGFPTAQVFSILPTEMFGRHVVQA